MFQKPWYKPQISNKTFHPHFSLNKKGEYNIQVEIKQYFFHSPIDTAFR